MIPPGGSRPTLLVETLETEEVPEADIDRMRRAMNGMACASGVIFGRAKGVILRDTYADLGVDSIVVDAHVDTDAVLTAARGGALETRVERWLEDLSVNWHAALTLDPNVAATFIQDVVPAASGSLVRRIDAA